MALMAAVYIFDFVFFGVLDSLVLNVSDDGAAVFITLIAMKNGEYWGLTLVFREISLDDLDDEEGIFVCVFQFKFVAFGDLLDLGD